MVVDSSLIREFNIYGTERIGYLEDRNYLGKKIKGKNVNLLPASGMKTLPTIPPSISPLPSIPTFTSILGGSGSSLVKIYYGKKRYELSDWLGNVRVVVSDKKVPDSVSGNIVLNYRPEVLSIRDYYAYGSDIFEHTHSTANLKYRYSFNGKEDIDKSFQDYGARYYNKLLGRFISADPLIVKQQKYAELSSYQFASDMPIKFVDVDGLESGYKKPDGTWVTQGDNLQRKPTAEEVKLIENTYHKGKSPRKDVIIQFAENFLSPYIILSTSAVLPIVNQVYTTLKEGIHPGKAYDKRNELQWAVPYKLELDYFSIKLVPLKQDLHQTFEGKEGYEKGGKIFKDATIDAMWELPIKTNNLLEWLGKKYLENKSGEVIKESIDKIQNAGNSNNDNSDNVNKTKTKAKTNQTQN